MGGGGGRSLSLGGRASGGRASGGLERECRLLSHHAATAYVVHVGLARCGYMHIGAAARGALSKLWTRPPQCIRRRARWQTPWWGTMARWGLSKVTQRGSVDAHWQEATTPWREVLALKPVGMRRTAVARRRVKGARRATGRVAHELWRWAYRRARSSHSFLPKCRLLWRWAAVHGLRRTCRTHDLWAATGCGCGPGRKGLAHDQRAAICQMQHLRACWRHYTQVGFAGG